MTNPAIQQILRHNSPAFSARRSFRRCSEEYLSPLRDFAQKAFVFSRIVGSMALLNITILRKKDNE
jgi:hypothetical protein